jgi:hypothetical protein
MACPLLIHINPAARCAYNMTRYKIPNHETTPMPILLRTLIGATLISILPLAQAQEAAPIHPALHDSFYFALGAFVPKTTTSAQLDSSTLGAGANIDFERALGITNQKTVPDAFARWRISDRWRAEAEYFALNRMGSKVLEQQIQWGDKVFAVGTDITSKFNFADVRVSGGYSFFRTPDKELGVGLGFHVASYNVGLDAAGSGDEAKKVTAPLPVLSAYGTFALTEKWAVGARLDRFAISYDKYDGNLTSMGVDLNYQPFKHVGFGFAYRSLFITLKATGDQLTAKFAQTFQGPLLYMNASF